MEMEVEKERNMGKVQSVVGVGGWVKVERITIDPEVMDGQHQGVENTRVVDNQTDCFWQKDRRD